MKKILLLALLLLPTDLLAQIRTFHYEESGLDAAKPGSCTTPYFYNAIGFLNYCRSGILVSAGRTGTRLTASGLGQILVSTTAGTTYGAQSKVAYDLRDYISCNGTNDNTAGMNTLLTVIGGTQAKLIFPSGVRCLLSAISFPATLTLDFSSGGGIKVARGQIVTLLGPIFATTQQIFFNALASQGTIDFTGGTAISAVYPEWWGASPSATAAINTAAIQAAIYGAFGCGPTACRTNPSGLAGYNRELRFSGQYSINDELQVYHMLNFLWSGNGMLKSGLLQTASNKRIIDGQNVAYGAFNNMSFQTNASQDDNHPLIDFEAGGQGIDLFDQFVTFNSDLISCGGVGNIGVQISPNGESNGNNFNFNNVAGKSCNTAVAQIGNASNNAFNALSNIWYGGDIQGAPKYGLAAYAGQWIVHGTTFEDGLVNQTGEDVYCHTAQIPCILDGVRSESMHLASGNYLSIQDSRMVFQAATWDQGALTGTVAPLNQLITGDSSSGDGAYYYVTTGGTWGGLNSTNATSGSASTIVCSGCTWNVNQWNGMHVGIVSGKGAGAYGIVSSNTATTITVPSWINHTPPTWTFYSAAPPDNTSVFVIEPNWGTQTTSGSVTFAAVPGYVVGGGTDGATTPAQHVDIQNSELIGLPINVAGSSVRNSIFSRRDFVSSNAALSLNTLLQRNFTGNQVYLPCQGCLASSGSVQTYQLSTSNSPYIGANQWNLGTTALVWSCSSARGGGTPCNDISIGGRSDPASGTSVSRSILEAMGTLGRATPSGTDKNGVDMDIQGGLPTGAGTPGNINFLTGNARGSSSNIVDGTRRWRITAFGHFFAFADNTYDIGAAAANRPRTGYFGTSIVTPIVALSANITWTSGAGVPSADSCVAANGGSLYSRTDGDATHTLYVCDNSTHTWTPK